jgi:hypothetical protein
MWRALTPAERKLFAHFAKTTAGNFRHYVEGRRNFTPEVAIRTEKAAVRMRLKPISRAELSATCSKCEFARACLDRELT